MRLKVLVVTWLLATSVALASQSATPAPVLFFSDLIVGANTGNSDTTYPITGGTARGVYVELYGNYLDNYSSVKLGGASCVTVVSAPTAYLWYERMAVMISNACSTGNWSITTPGGTFSGPMLSTTDERRTNDFTVVSGHVYYVSSSGNNSNSGSFSSPWAGADHGECSMADGDVTYLENGYTDTSIDGCSGDTAIISPASSACSSSTSSQRALVGYPGATATLGSNSVGNVPFQNYSMPCNGYELAELTLRTATTNAITIVAADNAGGSGTCPTSCTYNMRMVALDIQCPTPGSGAETGCVADGGGFGGSGDPTYVDGVVYYGDHITNTGNSPSDTLYHAEYHGTTQSLQIAWGLTQPLTGNTSSTPGVWNDIQIYTSNPSYVSNDIHVHDMILAGGAYGHGLLLASFCDPATSGQFSSGCEIYNNVIYGTGLSGNDNDCVQLAGIQPSGSVTNNVYNNTFYNCGATGEWGPWTFDTAYYASGCTASTCITNLTNNIMYTTAGYYLQNCQNQCYPSSGPTTAQIVGSNNDLYGLGAVNSSTVEGGWSATGSLNSNPNFTSTSTPSFVPMSGSAVIGAGSTSLYSTYDITGLLRPSPPSIGAYEYAAATSDPVPAAPTGLTAVVQ